MSRITLDLPDSIVLRLEEKAALYRMPVEQLAAERLQASLLEEEDYDWSLDLPEEKLEWMRQEIAKAEAQFERGEGIDGETFMLDLLKRHRDEYGLEHKTI